MQGLPINASAGKLPNALIRINQRGLVRSIEAGSYSAVFLKWDVILLKELVVFNVDKVLRMYVPVLDRLWEVGMILNLNYT